MNTNIRTVLKRGKTVLEKNLHIRDPHEESELLLGSILRLPREYIVSHPEHQVSKEAEKRFQELAEERATGKPLAYLTGQKEFYKLLFNVTPDVMIPRPETEMLVDEVIRDYQAIDRERNLFIADIGTGSGCIAVALAHNLLRSRISAVDISEPATKVAFKNFITHGTEFRIELLNGNLLEPIPNLLDVVVANLPYLPEGTEISPEVQFEPKIALYSGKDGLEHIRELLHQIPEYLRPGGRAYLEIHPPQADALQKIVRQTLPNAQLEIKKDLSHKDRIAKITLYS